MFRLFKGLYRALHVRELAPPPASIVVDYDSPPYLPIGAMAISRHEPLFAMGRVTIPLSRIGLIEIPFGLTVDEWRAMAAGRVKFCDAKVLDALIFGKAKNNELRASDMEITKKLIAQLGEGTGPVYFLGTTFAINREEEGVAILNRGGLSSLRYLIRTKEPVTALEWSGTPSNYAAICID